MQTASQVAKLHTWLPFFQCYGDLVGPYSKNPRKFTDARYVVVLLRADTDSPIFVLRRLLAINTRSHELRMREVLACDQGFSASGRLEYR